LIIIFKKNASELDLQTVCSQIKDFGFDTLITQTDSRKIVTVIGSYPDFKIKDIVRSMKGVEDVVPLLKPFHFISREFKPENTIIQIGDVSIGGEELVVMAGPSAVERRDQVLLAAFTLREAGAKVLRGCAYKSRTQFDVNPSLGRECLELLKEAKQESGLLVITEVRNPKEVELVCQYADILQISAVYMQYYELLAAAADAKKPVLLKRGMMSSIEEWLIAAEYIYQRGNPNIILCERGIRTFEKYTAYTLDLSAVPVVKRMSHLPVIVDPSHGTGYSKYVPAMSKAAIAAGADGILVEVHPSPDAAVLYGVRQMELQDFKEMMNELRVIAQAIGRNI
jgi:3-deoxy-7-phosphoheptulonate synthase